MKTPINTLVLHGDHLLRTLDLPWYASPWTDAWDLVSWEPIILDLDSGWYSYVVLPQ